MTDYKDKLTGFAAKLKASPNNTPIQEVTPVVKKIEVVAVEKSALNIWIPKQLKKRMRQKEIETDMNLTDIATAAIEEFLNK